MKYNYTQPANELQRFADMVEFPDAEPTENSAQLVTSGGVYDAIQNASQSVETDVKDYVDEVAATKADKDGISPDLTAGTALQLLGNTYTEDKTPYNFRKSGGSVKVGTREKDKIVGGTVAWNQLWKYYAASYVSVCSITKNADNDYTLTSIATGQSNYKYGIRNNLYSEGFTILSNHKYLFIADITPSFDSTVMSLYASGGSYFSMTVPANTKKTIWLMVSRENPSTNNDFFEIQFLNMYTEAVGATVRMQNAQIFDLTQMFGSAIADYIYSLETANAGAGVAYFRSLFPKPYYDYNAGEQISVKTTAHKTVGFNALDIANCYNSTNCDLVGSTLTNKVTDALTYFSPSLQVLQGSTPIVRIDFTEATTIDGRICRKYTIPSGYDYGNGYSIRLKHNGSTRDILLFETANVIAGAEYCISILQESTNPSVVGGLKLTDINLNISSSHNGDYEPYELHSYPLDADLELRGIPKLDANNALYYDGDIYEADGSVKRRYGIVDLSTLTWSHNIYNSQSVFYSASLDESRKVDGVSCQCAKYTPAENKTNGTGAATNGDKTICLMGPSNLGYNRVYVCDNDYTDIATFTAAMSGVYLVYELGSFTTEEADPFNGIQIVSEYGTEEYVDERAVAIPIGHETEYPTDLVAKIEEIPDPPTADGTYTLKAVVSGGVATYSWG